MILASGSAGCGAEADANRVASVVLEIILDHNPAHLSVEEIIREVAVESTNVGERCDVSDAIQELARAGLVHRSGSFVFATRAAVRASELGI
jgi:Fe2+ or Zn2+ uptake regulation protein